MKTRSRRHRDRLAPRRRRAHAGVRRAGRPDPAVQGDPAEALLRHRGLAAVRGRSCELPEYYPTRTERAILEANAAALVEATRPAELVELGSGVPTKTLLLLDAMRDAGTLDRYVPFDVSEVVLRESAKLLVERYPGIRVFGVVGDFERHLDALPARRGPARDRLPGRHDRQLPAGHAAARSCARSASALRPQDRLLLGTDLVKDPAVLEAAYNDSAGVTAAFNRNMLAVINRELDADFDLDAFEHVAFYDREQEWIEMRLRARARRWTCTSASSGSTCTSPTARSCAPRSAPSSPASGWRPTCARPASCSISS